MTRASPQPTEEHVTPATGDGGPGQGSTAAAGWLFDRTTDLWTFGGSAALSALLLLFGAATGLLDAATPVWLWLWLVVFVDVAHVWTTLFRTYLDGDELRRHRLRYAGVPLGCYLLGTATHAVSPALFWRVLAYVAVFHFIRQQVGWLALYERRRPAPTPLDRRLEQSALHAAMVYPLIHWHAHLPAQFAWFMPGDFAGGWIDGDWVEHLAPFYWALMITYLGRQAVLWSRSALHPGKLLLVVTTWACWHLGIVTFASDYAFTVTNVIIHGAPYAVLIYRHGRARTTGVGASLSSRLLARGALPFCALCLLLATLEELGWDHLVWHEHDRLFGPGPLLSDHILALVVPLLAVPQATHYVLDGLIWRTRSDPALRASLSRMADNPR
ncbi:MAG: hypothetical protein OXU20_18680 [Myxococcales bacterium]|nr:hypothetical protein [Myxococcales bacterium]